MSAFRCIRNYYVVIHKRKRERYVHYLQFVLTDMIPHL